jgi:hypothetical protein
MWITQKFDTTRREDSRSKAYRTATIEAKSRGSTIMNVKAGKKILAVRTSDEIAAWVARHPGERCYLVASFRKLSGRFFQLAAENLPLLCLCLNDLGSVLDLRDPFAGGEVFAN